MKVFKKSDEDVLDYDIDMSDWLEDGDEVDAADVVYDRGSDIEYRGKMLFVDRVKIWIAGGVAGETYPIKVLVHTEGGRIKEVNLIIAVTEQ